MVLTALHTGPRAFAFASVPLSPVSRQLRLEYPGALWHVTSRGNERRDIVRDDEDRRLFVRLLARVIADRRWILHAWVLMTNHYHLLIETPELGLSRGMKWLNQTYAEFFNERHERVGHLFQGRFKGILVEREGHLLELVRYIVLNPVRAAMTRSAEEYLWSNYRATAGLAPVPSWLEVDWTLRQFATGRNGDPREEYSRFVADGRAMEYRPWDALAGQIYLGCSEFRERMQAVVESKSRSLEHPRPQREVPGISLDLLAASVADAFGVPLSKLSSRSRSHERKALARVAVADAGLTVRAVAKWLRISESATSKLRKASDLLYETDAEYRAHVDEASARLKFNF